MRIAIGVDRGALFHKKRRPELSQKETLAVRLLILKFAVNLPELSTTGGERRPRRGRYESPAQC
jgi:hypothetical protein